MGKVTRKRHGARFKAKVALEAMRGERTLAEPGARYGIHQAMIAAWKRQAIDGLTATFAVRRDDPKRLFDKEKEREVTQLRAKACPPA